MSYFSGLQQPSSKILYTLHPLCLKPPSSPFSNIHCSINSQFRLDDGPHGPPPCSQSLHARDVSAVWSTAPGQPLAEPWCHRSAAADRSPATRPHACQSPGPGRGAFPPTPRPAWRLFCTRCSVSTSYEKDSPSLYGFFYVNCRSPVNSPLIQNTGSVSWKFLRMVKWATPLV